MKKLAIKFSVLALMALPASYVNASVKAPVAAQGFNTGAFVKSLVFGTSSVYGLNNSSIDFIVTFAHVSGTPGSTYTYLMPAGFYNPSDQWTFPEGFYNVTFTPTTPLTSIEVVSANGQVGWFYPGSSSYTLSNVQYYAGGGNVAQIN